MKKVKDLSVKVDTYTDKEGNPKGKYQNVGAVMEDDEGHQFLLFDRTFNPAGMPNPENRTNIIISMFDIKSKDDTEGFGNNR